MRISHRLSGLAAATLLVVPFAVTAQTTTTNPYRATLGWEQLPEGRTLGIISGVWPDPDGEHLWILDRCGANQCAGSDLDPILKFDLDGNLVDSLEQASLLSLMGSRWTARATCG